LGDTLGDELAKVAIRYLCYDGNCRQREEEEE